MKFGLPQKLYVHNQIIGGVMMPVLTENPDDATETLTLVGVNPANVTGLYRSDSVHTRQLWWDHGPMYPIPEDEIVPIVKFSNNFRSATIDEQTYEIGEPQPSKDEGVFIATSADGALVLLWAESEPLNKCSTVVQLNETYCAVTPETMLTN